MTTPTCPAGHPWTAANTYRRPNGKRTCRTCRRLAVALWREHKRRTDPAWVERERERKRESNARLWADPMWRERHLARRRERRAHATA